MTTPQQEGAIPYTRALALTDYDVLLRPYIQELAWFERRLAALSVPYRKDHEHRAWEYGNVLRQLDELAIRPPAIILDTGSGANYLAPYLACQGYDVTVEDSMGYGDLTEWLIQQCLALRIRLPILAEPVEAMPSLPDASMDLTLCISTIEHVGADRYEDALHELARVTKPGGYVFLTSDFFKDEASGELSPFRQIQHTRFTEPLVRAIPLIEPRLSFVGGVDLAYRGDYVNNYSFVNAVFQKSA